MELIRKFLGWGRGLPAPHPSAVVKTPRYYVAHWNKTVGREARR